MPAIQGSAPGSYSPRGPTGLATGGSYDFVLALGQDDGLMAYVSTLDMLFAPIVRAALRHTMAWQQLNRSDRRAQRAPRSEAPRRASLSKAKVRCALRDIRQAGMLTSRAEEARAALLELISIKTRVSFPDPPRAPCCCVTPAHSPLHQDALWGGPAMTDI